MAGSRPNILFIFSDQQRWDSLGCYGQALPTTPHLDRMAAEGVRFTNTFTCQPLCGPLRSCIHTGKYATETGCFMNDIALPLDERTMAHWLREAGYEAGYLGKWHLASTGERYARPGNRPGQQEAYNVQARPVPPERRGGYLDYWLAADVLEYTSHGYDGHLFDGDGRQVDFPEGRYRVDALTDFAVDYLRTRTGEQPFFLFLSYLEPHWQNDRSRHDAPEGMEELFTAYETPGDLVNAGDEVGWLTEGWRKEYARYLACVHSLDQNVGRLRATLEEEGLSDNTLVIYTSDHGCHFGSRHPGAKDSCHDASLHVPLLMYGPGFTGGSVREALVSLLDLPSTVLTAGGVEPPSSMRGQALQPLVDGSAASWRDEVFYQISPMVLGRGIRTDRWKYAVKASDTDGWDTPASDVYVDDCLYDLQADPHEQHNLAADPAYADIRAELRPRLAAHIREVEGIEATILPVSQGN